MLVDNGGSLVNEVESVGGILWSIFLERLYCFGILLQRLDPNQCKSRKYNECILARDSGIDFSVCTYLGVFR